MANIPDSLPSEAGANLTGAPNPDGQKDNGGRAQSEKKAADASMSTFDDGSSDD
jgi:hypothetical protein